LVPIDEETGEPIWLIADSSDYGTGAFLCQGSDWKTAKPAGFYSRALRAAERNYPTHEKEMLAIVAALKRWRTQLAHGVPFTVLTDHQPLKYWQSQTHLSKRQMRWLETLADYNFDIKYIPGLVNRVSDGLSRYPLWRNPSPLPSDYDVCDEAVITEVDPATEKNGPDAGDHEPPTIAQTTVSSTELDSDTLEAIREEYEKDNFFSPIVASPDAYDAYIFDDGLLWLEDGRLCIPNNRELRQIFIHDHHDAQNHFGFDKTYANIREKLFWPNLANDVRSYIRTCDSCGRNTGSTQRQVGLQRPLPIPQARFRDIAMDFVGPLREGTKGEDHLLVITDRLTGWVQAHANKGKFTATKTAQVVFDHWYSLFGIPSTIVSDRDTIFTSKFWGCLHDLLGTELKMSTSFHPETDGTSERSNKTIIESLRHFVDSSHANWPELLPKVVASINMSKSLATGFSPFELVFGSDPKPLLLPTRQEGAAESSSRHEIHRQDQ
jgi:hypothetical protein